MKITILNGNPDASNNVFDGYLKRLSGALASENHVVTILNLREMDIRYCIGCFGCWAKTPGECIVRDASGNICHEYINSGFVLFASPIIMGFTSALLKKAHEKLIPLVHPYLEFVQNEVHHLRRYSKYPLMGLLLEKGRDADEEDLKIISDIYRRDAINLRTSFCFTKLTSDPVEEVANEINRL
ncbi:MAG: NAD(P)H-dependent oxidoreductase [Dehalococcoidia bacterium]|nr:NAD(P)H-dependent oxidoreductase [Dehalococcoidia bacterium]